MHPKDADGMANIVDPDQTALGLHCLLRLLSEKDHYDIQSVITVCLLKFSYFNINIEIPVSYPK